MAKKIVKDKKNVLRWTYKTNVHKKVMQRISAVAKMITKDYKIKATSIRKIYGKKVQERIASELMKDSNVKRILKRGDAKIKDLVHGVIDEIKARHARKARQCA